jgi:hypothetical protein
MNKLLSHDAADQIDRCVSGGLIQSYIRSQQYAEMACHYPARAARQYPPKNRLHLAKHDCGQT